MVPRYELALAVRDEFGRSIAIEGLGSGGVLVGHCRTRRQALVIEEGSLRWLGPAGRRSEARAIADGRVYGTLEGRACWFDGNRVVELPGLGGDWSGVTGAAGRFAIGWADTDRWDVYEAGTDNEHRSPRRVGVRWEGEHGVELSTLGGTNAMAERVNRHGVAVGDSEAVHEGTRMPCRWSSAGEVEALGDSSVRQGKATAVNEHGEIVGWIHEGNDRRYRPFVRRGDSFERLLLPGDHAFPKDINRHGHIVGSVSWDSDEHSWPREVRAHLWVGGRAYDLNAQLDGNDSRALYHANRIDDAGMILATRRGPDDPVLLRPR